VAAKKPVPVLVTIDRKWQLTFIAAVVLWQVGTVATMLWAYFRIIHYMSFGTWMFQATQLVYPVLYAGVAYLFIRKKIQGRVPTLFWTLFVTSIGMLIAQVIASAINTGITIFNLWPTIGANASWWQQYGWSVLPLIIATALYIGTLMALTWGVKRR
jgi:hypothetical protein